MPWPVSLINTKTHALPKSNRSSFCRETDTRNYPDRISTTPKDANLSANIQDFLNLQINIKQLLKDDLDVIKNNNNKNILSHLHSFIMIT